MRNSFSRTERCYMGDGVSTDDRLLTYRRVGSDKSMYINPTGAMPPTVAERSYEYKRMKHVWLGWNWI